MRMVSNVLASIGVAAGASLLATGAMSFAQPAPNGSARTAAPVPSGGPFGDPRYEAFGRRIREGISASRAVKPLPIRPATNGVEQLPIDNVLGRKLFKREGIPPAPPPSQARSLRYVPGCPSQPGMKTASFLKVFPNVSWHVCVTDMGMKSLWVGPVELKRTPASPWMTVLYQAGLAEIFVPYHQRTTFRPYDLNPWVYALDQVTQQDAGPSGTPRYLSNESVPTVVTEVRDRGIGWLCKQQTPYVTTSRRGQEFVVWGVADGGNYDNIVQYDFRDDGSIGFRLGNTGYSDPSSPDEAHMHTGLWRVDMDLNGPANDTAYYETHNEYGTLTATDTITPVNFEGAFKWIDTQFKTLLIQDASTNAYGHRIGYEFTPAHTGVARHFGSNDQWTQDDVYVTRYHGNELGWTTTWNYPDTYLAATINGESTNNQDVVVWVKASAHHHPTDEDRSVNDLGTTNISGITLVHWSGFDIEPHDLFNTNPLGGPPRCGN